MSLRVCTRRAHGPRAITLIELLVVITIILILMGLLMTAVGTVQAKARSRATLTLFQTLGTSLELYHNEFDAYPDSPSTTAAASTDYDADDGSLFAQLNGSDGRGAVKSYMAGATKVDKHYEPFAKLPPESTKRNGDQTLIVDAWGRPIHYFNCEPYILAQTAGLTGQAAQDARDTALRTVVHSATYELYSYGVNGRFDEVRHDMVDDNSDGRMDDENEGGDDITNW